MTWFKVDDSFYDHPKVFDAPDCAVALWTRAGTWSARNLTDGFVPSGLPARLCGDPDTAVKELVRRGLWSRTRDGFQFHDWRSYQPSPEQVLALREKRAAAGKRGGQAKAAKQKAKQTPSKDLAIATDVGKQNATPSRPPSFYEGGRDARPASLDASRAPENRAGAHPPSASGLEDPEALAREQAEIAADVEAKVRHFADLQRRTERGAAAARAAIAGARRPPPARVNGLDALREATPDVVVPLAEPEESAP